MVVVVAVAGALGLRALAAAERLTVTAAAPARPDPELQASLDRLPASSGPPEGATELPAP